VIDRRRFVGAQTPLRIGPPLTVCRLSPLAVGDSQGAHRVGAMGGWKKQFLSNEEDGSKVYLVGYSTEEQKSKLQGVFRRLHNTACMTRHFVPPFNGGEPEQLFTGRKGVTDLFT